MFFDTRYLKGGAFWDTSPNKLRSYLVYGTCTWSLAQGPERNATPVIFKQITFTLDVAFIYSSIDFFHH